MVTNNAVRENTVPITNAPKRSGRFSTSGDNYISTMIVGAVLINCVLIVIASYFWLKKCNNYNKSKSAVVEKYHNYRQDASITTPLIGTSNVNTDTTNFNYYNESPSKLRNDIKEKRDNIKSSHLYSLQKYVSDDAILKIKSRRDWIRNASKSEAIHNVYKETTPAMYRRYDASSQETLDMTTATSVTTQNDSTVSYSAKKDPVPHEPTNKVDKIVDEETSPKKRQIQFVESTGTFNEVFDSECEITCHSYTSQQFASESKCEPLHIKPNVIQRYDTKYCEGLGYHKSAQAVLSKDSVDNFISQYGLSVLEDSDKSKLVHKKIVIQDSKQSMKSNVVRNAISSLFKKRVKSTATSDPGKNIFETGFCAYSTSNNNTQCCCQTNIFQESRSTF